MDSDKREIGFIAEEVAEVLPEVVSFEADGTTALGLDYSRLTAVLVEAVQTQQEQINDLRAQLDALRSEMIALRR